MTTEDLWGSDASYNQVKMYLVPTEKTDFTSTTDWISYKESDLVYDGNIRENIPGAKTKIVLDNPFSYDGMSGLALITVQENGGYVAGPYPKHLTFDATAQAMYVGNSGTPYDASSLSSYTGLIMNQKNQLWLDVTPSAVIGSDGTATGEAPIFTANKYGFTEQIYTKEEIGKTGLITSLSFYSKNSATDSDERTRSIDVYVKTSYGTSLGSAYGAYWEQVYETDKVFSGNVTIEGGKWTKIVLDKPFRYSGADNLLIAIDDNTGTAVTSYDDGAFGSEFLSSYTDVYSVLCTASDDDIDALSLKGYTSKANLIHIRPQVIIGFHETWQIGEGTATTDMLPYPAGQRSTSISQQIYTADEIGEEEADITSLSFFYNGRYTASSRNIDIYLTDPTYPSAFEGENSWVPVTADDMVFSGRAEFNQGDWTDIPLSRPFHYSRIGGGLHNLLLTIVDKTGGYDSKFLSYEAEGGAIVAQRTYGFKDPTEFYFNPEDMTDVSGTVVNQKNQIQFNNLPVSIRPINLRVSDITLTSAYVQWNKATTDIDGWQLQYKATDEMAWNYLPGNLNASQTDWMLTDLTPAKTYDLRLCAVIDSEYGEWAEVQFSTNLQPTDIDCYSQLTYNSNTITWKGPGTLWDFQYKPGTETIWKGVTNISEPSYTLTNLEEYTSYDVRIRCTDGNDHFGQWVMAGFNTPERYPRPNDFYCISVSTHSAVLTWEEEGDAKAWQICIDDNEDNLIDVNQCPYILTGLTPGTGYTLKIRSVINDGEAYSAWSYETWFMTESPNADIASMEVTPLSTSATITWTGTSDSYDVRYRRHDHRVITFSEDFELGDLDTKGWTIYTEGEAPKADGWNRYGGFSHGGAKGVVAYSWYSSIEYDADNWLITPLVDLKGTLKYWERCDPINPDKYAVLLSLTDKEKESFTTVLREMNPGNATDEWVEVSLDLSAYEGQQGYIAFHHVDKSAKYLSLDDISISYLDESLWTTVQTTEPGLTIEGLDTGTEYEYQIVGHMDGVPDVSTVVMTFTTLAGNTLSDFAVKVTPTTAKITWTGENDHYSFVYRTAAYTKQEDEVTSYVSQDFESGVSPWWTVTDYWSYLAAGEGVDGSKAYCISGSSGDALYLFSPALSEIPEGAVLKFDYKLQDIMGFSVGYTTSPYEVYIPDFTGKFTWTSIEGDPEEMTPEWKSYTLALPKDVTYVAFKQEMSNDTYIDNISITKTVTSTIDVPAGPSQFIDNLTETEVLLEGLEKGTKYDFCVVGLDAEDYLETVSSDMTFTTPLDAVDIALDNDADNRTFITDNDGLNANVTIKNLTFKAGEWQAVCLPFNLELEGSVLEGADVREFESAYHYTLGWYESYLMVDCLTPVTKLTAGTPYLIRWNGTDDLADPVFNEVLLSNKQETVSAKYALSDLLAYYDVYTIANEHDYAFTGFDCYYYKVSGSALVRAHVGEQKKAFEPVIKSPYADDEMLLNTGDNDRVTGITSVREDAGQPVYNVAGQRLQKMQKGINIVGGKKILVK